MHCILLHKLADARIMNQKWKVVLSNNVALIFYVSAQHVQRGRSVKCSDKSFQNFCVHSYFFIVVEGRYILSNNALLLSFRKLCWSPTNLVAIVIEMLSIRWENIIKGYGYSAFIIFSVYCFLFAVPSSRIWFPHVIKCREPFSTLLLFSQFSELWKRCPNSKVHGANMGPPGSCRPQEGPCRPH